jgi:hypothetical protein
MIWWRPMRDCLNRPAGWDEEVSDFEEYKERLRAFAGKRIHDFRRGKSSLSKNIKYHNSTRRSKRLHFSTAKGHIQHEITRCRTPGCTATATFKVSPVHLRPVHRNRDVSSRQR